MFYFLSDFRTVFFGFNLFKYITFRSGMATITSFLLCIILGPLFVRKFKEWQIREIALRDDCPQLDHLQRPKEGTPTMGGIFIIISILVSVLLWGNLTNRFVLLTLVTCLWLAILGGVDDYIKLSQKKHQGLKSHRGLRARKKLLWQFLLCCLIGFFIYFDPQTSTRLDVPFMKNLAIDLGIFYIPLVFFIIVGTSNAVNLTDGLDGLAIGCILIATITLGILCYVSGHVKFSEYLFIPYLPEAGELTVFCFAIFGAGLGFLWFNCYPATVFMGDVGSLALGGTIAVIAVFIKKELLFVCLGGVFVVEALSVILQVASFRLTGKRIFKMSPMHHHLQLLGWNESKIIVRFWIIATILALVTLTTLKLR